MDGLYVTLGHPVWKQEMALQQYDSRHDMTV